MEQTVNNKKARKSAREDETMKVLAFMEDMRQTNTPADIPAIRNTEEVNPYLRLFRELSSGPMLGDSHHSYYKNPLDGLKSLAAREFFVDTFSFAVPDEKALQAIASLNIPVVEIGPRRGYWLWCLQRMGVQAEGYDIEVLLETWTDIKHISEYDPQKYGKDCVLFFCWPDHNDDEIDRLLFESPASTVVQVGEWGGCCGSPSFYRHLNEHFKQVDLIHIPKWHCMNDFMSIHTKLT
jgi:hypothetical protein